MLLQKKRRTIFIFFDNLLPKNYFAGNMKQDSTLERFRKNMSYIEEINIELEDRYIVIIKKCLPKKSKDLGSFNLPVSISALFMDNALLDLGASVNIIHLAMLKKIGDLESKPTKMQLRLANKSMKYPYGVVENVLVKVDKFKFPVNFFIMDMKEDEEVPLIHDRSFMKTVRLIVDVEKGELQVRAQDDMVTFNLFYGLKFFNVGEECIQKDETEGVVHLEINRRQAR